MVNEYFKWANPNLAQSITLSGQVEVRWIERKYPFNSINNQYLLGEK